MSTHTEPAFAVEIPSTCEHMPDVIDGVVRALLGMGAISASQDPKIRICMQEAIVNAIRHGNLGQVEKKVRVEVLSEQGGSVIRVYDEGEGFNPVHTAEPDAQSAGGRGLRLMQHFVDDINYNMGSKCLELRLNAPQIAQGE